ncbi:hypothetical protein KKD19_06030 [Patescibacteria group bacterium]|nr:hypothetical protein [Patescibacteria group bacterium]MBU4512762.1 hypothetical protein [Patescibacteria group bacterium]MCG2693101.1 hypothetical protein [Candidatus Parcubacteria bacterium]
MPAENKYQIVEGSNLDGLIGKRIRIVFNELYKVEGKLLSIANGSDGEPIFCFEDSVFILPSKWLWRSGELREWASSRKQFLWLYGYGGRYFQEDIEYEHLEYGRTAIINGVEVPCEARIRIEESE